MKILLTGGIGYIGSHTMVELLNNNYEIVCIDNFFNSKREVIDRIKKITGKDFKFYEGDVCCTETLEQIFSENEIDAVIHFAGYKAVGESTEKPLMYYRNNLDSTLSLLEVMNKYNCKYLFLAHHLNDDIETSLMHIIRGSNLKGYAGIEEVVYNNDNKIILRPFLTTLKQDIIDYSKKNNIRYFEDDSNNSDCYTRNRIRHHLVQDIFEENESFEKQFLEFKDNILNSYKIVCDVRDQYIKENIEVLDHIEFDISSFNQLSEFMRTEVLFELLYMYQIHYL